MADKNPIEAGLAVAVHKAEYDYGKALAAPAGPNRIETINAAADALGRAEADYQRCLDGRGYGVAPKR